MTTDPPPTEEQPRDPSATSAKAPRKDIRTFRSDELFQDGTNEVWILHEGKTYRLLKTRFDKLILIK